MSLSDFFKKDDSRKNSMIDKSMEWMRGRSQSISQKLVKENATKLEQSGRWGHIYQFVYDAKTKSKLKYYDYFPMSIVLEQYKDGFLGLNLHYLPTTMRFAFMDKLWNFVSSPTGELDEDTRFILRYNMLKSIGGKKFYKPCIKRYLYSQMRTPLYHIPSDKWVFAMVLPSSKFFDKQGNNILPKDVYIDSRNSIINNK